MSDVALPYGAWPSPIKLGDLSPSDLAAALASPGEPQVQNGVPHWLESRPEEAGRVALMRQEADGPRELTPAPFNVRSRVHEYGGAAYLAAASGLWFVNAADQNIYRINSDGGIRQTTHSDASTRYADLQLDAARGQLIAVTEIHRQGEAPRNALAAIDLQSGEAALLHAERDFYAWPRLSKDGKQLLFVAWDHPNMPWDGTELLCADLAGTGIGAIRTIAGGIDESVLQPVWRSDGSVLYLSDATGYWNLYQLDARGPRPLLAEQAEYGSPPWLLGRSDYACVGERRIVARRYRDGEQDLMLIDLQSGTAEMLPDDCTAYSHLCAHGEDAVCFIGSHWDAATELARYSLSARRRETLAPGRALRYGSECFRRPRHIRLPTRDGACAYGYLYRPGQPPQGAAAEGKPPLMLTAHGGPTGAALPSLNLLAQFYASRGWMVLDLNYRGSTGYGRRYRDALKGRWGLLDVADCVDAVAHLNREGAIDPDRVAIRGGSAGGYTSLRALTTASIFRAGASLYGIGDLTALVQDTHKFESRYLEVLVGGGEALAERSPINHMDGFDCPAIFFQGGEDRIVPPNQTQAMVAALRDRGIPVACIEFPEEGHGFRDGANIVRAIGAEYAFFCRVFGIPLEAGLPDLEIHNL